MLEPSTATTILQGTPEWLALRCGKVTASRIADLTARTKSGYSASRAAYMGQLLAERLTGVVQNGFQSRAMLDGIEREPQARAAYEFIYEPIELEEVAFINHPTIPMAGCSPDGLVMDPHGTNGLIEIKCPAVHTHIETLLSETIDLRYVKQMQFQLAVCNRQWCEFISFHPDMPANMRLFVQRVQRDNGMIAELETEVREFQRELEVKLAALKEKFK
jgi:putative phage-type endonuclease